MLTVYAIPVSLYCAKLRIVLRHKGLEWQEIPPPGGYGADEYKAIVPSGNLPALLDGALLLCDSEVIAEYLDETYPAPPMLAGDPTTRARQRDIGRFHDTRLEPALRAVFPYLPGRTDPPADFLENWCTDIETKLEQFGRLLELAPAPGKELSLGDCGYPITLAWLTELAPRFGQQITLPEPIAEYRTRIEAHPAVKTELASYRPKLSEFLDG